MKMKSGNERKKIIRELLNRTDQEFTDEELIHQLIMTNITENSNETEKLSFGQRASDAVAKFAGSWAFIFSFIAVMVGWMAVNVILGTKACLPVYPFKSGTFLHCCHSGSPYHDEPEPTGGKGQTTRGKRL